MDPVPVQTAAAAFARTLEPAGGVPPRRLEHRLRSDLRAVRTCRETLWRWSAGRPSLPPAAEWLLDNHYLALREGREARTVFARGRALRGTRQGECLLLACARGALETVPVPEGTDLEAWLAGFQTVYPLTERELSLLIPALTAVCLHRLAKLCRDPEALERGEGDPEAFRGVFTVLRTLSAGSWGPVLEGASRVEQILARDPSGHYPAMDEATRRRYRQQVCRLARRQGLEETEAARQALELAEQAEGEERHVGWWLYRRPLGQPARTPSGALYGICVLLLSLGAALGLWRLSGSGPAAVLLLLPLSDIVKNTLDFLLVRLVPPRPVPGMELPDGIPPEGRTLCVIVSLLTDQDSGPELAARLERYRLANRDAGTELRFGLLADLPDSRAPLSDEGRDRVRAAREAVEELNRRHGGGFYLFFRRPAFNPRDERWMGWERKRGALVELVRLLKGRASSLRVLAGDAAALEGTRYVITLDSDTALNVGAARELAGAMLHPLNQPRIDPRRRIVTAGHALFQPRSAVDLEAANRSFFARVYGGLGGVDPYGCAASDVYHDLFDQGTYTGKGIFHVDAFFTCLEGRFPDNAILSHDLLEGSYLRAGLLGEVELTDGCPYKVHSWFSRLHRWFRGDWQLLPWLLPRVPDGSGGREPNPLPLLARWKLLDNLRRSLSPVFTLAALLLALCLRGRVFAWTGAVAVTAAASHLLLSGAELAVGRARGEHRRYHSTVVAGLAGAVLQTALQLLFLPWQAWTALSAIVTALWRMLVSHRDLLVWVTAAQAEQGGDTLMACFRRAWFSPAIGVVVMLLARLRMGVLVGLLWVLAPAVAWVISRPEPPETDLPPADRAFLLHEATLIWRYFDRWLRPEDHWLPPDNWQEQPGPELARRTSPTNIGLALLAVLAARDLDLLPAPRALEKLEHMLDSLERLERWNGHLYNWYDTASARPLRPRYVSTVDSGNLRGCLIALAAGLRELGAPDLARRAEKLSAEMNCAPLYDPRRKLFSIGYDVEKGALTDGYYDLLASEARQTSFIAVARGEVPPRHWRRLGRMLLGDNDYSGLASWTGTMFEYFMPNLLLPCEPNSLMYESLAFCVYAQKRRGQRAHTPWGISESGFYAFDPALHYQYKAHGVQALGLKRELDADLVVAPYASFLALLLAPRSALRNLRRLRDMGLEGRYGLYEAVDWTPSRLTGSGRYEVVRSYMAHHLGMSLAAIDNTLRSNILQRRFLADNDMAAFRELLQERVPVGAPILRQGEREMPEALNRTRRIPAPALLREGTQLRRLRPACHLLSNGSYTVSIRDNGLTRSSLGEADLTLARPEDWYAPAGVSAFLETPEGRLGLTAAPLWQPGNFSWSFSADRAQWRREEDSFCSVLTLTVPQGEPGELRRVELTWRGQNPLAGALLFYLEPVLCRERDFAAHPAFSRLFLQARPVPGGVLFTRRPREKEEAPALAAVWEGDGATVCLDRARALGRGALRSLETREAKDLPPGTGADPCLLVRIPLTLQPGESLSLAFALGAGDSGREALEAARRILAGRAGPAVSPAPRIRALSLSEGQCLEAFGLLDALEAAEPPRERPPQSVLWPFGISGDLPIAAGSVGDREELERAILWCRWHQLLKRSGASFDLILLLEEGGDYRRPLYTALGEALRDMGAESALGARGGIHRVDQTAAPAVLAWAKARLPLSGSPAQPETVVPPPPARVSESPAPWRWDPDGVFTLETGTSLPPVGWAMVLANPEFGWLTDETGAGFLWDGGNAREGRLSPWTNDPLAVGGPERILLTWNGRILSPFADGDGLPCRVSLFPGWIRWEKDLGGARLTVTGFVPPDQPRRLLLFTAEEFHGELSVALGDLPPVTGTLRPGVPLALVTEGNGSSPVYRFQEEPFAPLLERTRLWWMERACPMTFETPDPALNRYLNGWCLGQVIACRLFARTSQYQNGGAFGFRDQLQDSLALLWTWPERTRHQILLAASRQFEEGDVQHWWHPPHGAGVRTRISDDLLWLPWVLCRYVEATGDRDILSAQIPWLSSPPLGAEERERYDTPAVTDRVSPVFDHALAAIRLVLARGFGAHGLALLGAGDWNDGLNRAGAEGRGESVWLTWFLTLVLQDFTPLCRERGEQETARELEEAGEKTLAAALDAWDGSWYRRGWYDSGAPLGSAASAECQLDSIAQSFAAFPAGTDRERASQALDSALERLFDREHRLVKLLDPPFSEASREDPGYLRGYPEGVRENGGQYTHAAVWLALACFRLNRPADGWEILSALLPEHHPTEVYRGEPYVLAADVSAAPGREGAAGWTWYTGAAGWFWQTAVGALLGLTVRNRTLTVSPCLPPTWNGFALTWRLPRGTLRLEAARGTGPVLLLDGTAVQGVDLDALEGEHHLTVRFGESDGTPGSEGNVP